MAMKKILPGLALGLVLFSCGKKEAPVRDPEAFAREKAAREVRRITPAQIMEEAYTQGRALRDGESFELPRLTAHPSDRAFYSYQDSVLDDGLPEKLQSLIASYFYTQAQGEKAQDNVQALEDSLLWYSFPTDSGVHVVTYPRAEIGLTVP